MRILTICEGGACRSVALARMLKINRHDAIAASWARNSAETLHMLGEWAELVVVMQPEMLDKISNSLRLKAEVCDVGKDRWGNPFAPDLMELCLAWMKKRGLGERTKVPR